MEIILEPHMPWHWVVSALAGLVAMAALVRGAVDRWRVFARRVGFRAGAVGLTVLACLFMAVAAWNPIHRPEPKPLPNHVVVVIDGSQSAMKDGETLEVVKRKLLSALPGSDATNLVLSIVIFGDGVKGIEERVPLADGLSRLRALSAGDLPQADETDIEKALRRAREVIRENGDAGAILLCSDGFETSGTVESFAGTLGREGIRVHALPVPGFRTPVSLSAAYLPSLVESGATIKARMVIRNEAPQPAATDLQFALNTSLTNSDNFSLEWKRALKTNLPANATLHTTLPVTFRGMGLQYFDATLDARALGRDHERLFTLVKRPPRILAVGTGLDWVQAFESGQAQVRTVSADQLNDLQSQGKLSFHGLDAIVIDGVSADQFHPEVHDEVVRSVEQMGCGFMLFNGPHGPPRKETDATVLMSYTNSLIHRILPVSTIPKPPDEKPKGKQVFILVDASGSMLGQPIICGKRIAKHIVQNLLQPEDTLDLVIFADTHLRPLKAERMTAAGKAKAIKAIDGIMIGGGTDPTTALAEIAKLKIENGGMIFISDGGFSPATIQTRPDCAAMVFEITGGGFSTPNTAMLKKLGEVYSVSHTFNPAGFTMSFFKPEKRTNYFTLGEFLPASMAKNLGNKKLYDPGLEMSGTALSFKKEGAQYPFYRMIPGTENDILLGYRPAGNGEAGVLTTGLPANWAEDPEGAKAITDWVMRVIPFNARDRYFIEVKDLGQDLQVNLTMADRQKPDVRHVSCHLKLADTEETDGGPMKVPVDKFGADFTRRLKVSRNSHAQEGYLFIEEQKGADALGRVQRIPILIPPLRAAVPRKTRERDSFGINEGLLRKITTATGGQYLSEADTITPPAISQARDIGTPFWHALFTAGFTCYLLAFAIQRLDT